MIINNLRQRIPLLLLLWLCSTIEMQAQDFNITKFQENLLDLTAARAAVKDKNGDVCALIKFSVRDNKFTFEPNMGVVKTEQKVGETWIYVPTQTKRITIRHPQLGILRDYVIPVNIEQKVVYEAELQITNQEYLRSLLQKAKTDTVRIMVPQDPTIVEVEAKRSAYFNVGAGFNVLGIMGPEFFLGFNFGKHSVEGGIVFGVNKVLDMSIYQSDNGAFYGAYDYQATRFFLRYGYDFTIGESFIVTPQLGVAINNITGTEVKHGNGSDLFTKVNTVSGTLGCRMSYCLGKSIRLQVTPAFNFGLKKDKSFDILKEADSTFKSWTEGLSLTAGIVFHF